MTGLRSPVLMILVLAPFLGECMSGATPPLDLLLPWNLALFVSLYGCGALLCREAVVRRGLGLGGLLWLGAAYGVYEEALVDRFWFAPTAWGDLGIGGYSEVWHTNLVVATHLTLFHMAVSMGGAVVLTHRAFPQRCREPWVRRRGLVLAGLALLAALPLYGQLGKGPLAQQLAVLGLCLGLLAIGLRTRPVTRPAQPLRPAGRLGMVAFFATAAHFAVVYGLPSSGLPWPAGLAATLAPVAAAGAVLRRGATWSLDGPAALRAQTGVLSFFVVFVALVGLAGRFDLTAGAIALGIALFRTNRQINRTSDGNDGQELDPVRHGQRRRRID